MSELPTRARIYVSTVVAFGTALLAASIRHTDFHHPVLFLVLTVVSATTAAFNVQLPLRKGGSTMSVSYAVDFASLFLIGPHLTTIVAVVSTFSQCRLNTGRKSPWYRTLFSMAALAVTVQATGGAYQL